MRPVPKSQAKMGMFWAICIYLALELAPALMAKLLLHKAVGQLVGPYLAFALPGVSSLLLILWLWKWEERGASPTHLALGWGLTLAFFSLALSAALLYSVVNLRLANPSDAVWVFGIIGVGGTASGFFVAYNMTLTRVSAKAVRDGSRPR